MGGRAPGTPPPRSANGYFQKPVVCMSIERSEPGLPGSQLGPFSYHAKQRVYCLDIDGA